MSEPNESPPAGAIAPAPTPRRGACLGRVLIALLVMVITAVVALMVGAAALLALGFAPDTPGQIVDTRARLATAEAQNADLRAQSGAMQTQIAELTRRDDANREALGELQQQKAALDSLRGDLEEAARQNATVVAEARSSRDAVSLFATAETGRVVLLDELKRRSDRIERFLQRLSDISDDAAQDLGSGAPSPADGQALATPAEPTDTPTPPEPTQTLTQIPTVEPSETPTATRRPAATARAAATPTPETSNTPEETPTPRP